MTFREFGSLVSILTALCAGATTGCLSGQLQVDRAELVRVSRLPPDRRGESIRVVQQTTFNADPLPTSTSTRSASASDTELGDEPEPATLVVVENGEPSHRRRHHREDSDDSARSNDGAKKDSGGSAAALTAVAAGALVVTGAGFFVAAPTEGGRYDGWVSLGSWQPLMLVDPDGTRRWTSVGELDPGEAARAEHGVLLDDDSVQRIGRAPLNRFGFASRLEVGGAPLSAKGGAADYGPQVRLTFGGFPLHRVGILVGGQFVAGSVTQGSISDSRVFNGRVFGEADWFPLRLGAFYGGMFGEVGVGTARQDIGGVSVARNGMTLAGGALCEVAINTRLALSFRANAASVPSLTPTSSIWIPEFAIGLSVY